MVSLWGHWWSLLGHCGVIGVHWGSLSVSGCHLWSLVVIGGVIGGHWWSLGLIGWHWVSLWCHWWSLLGHCVVIVGSLGVIWGP